MTLTRARRRTWASVDATLYRVHMASGIRSQDDSYAPLAAICAEILDVHWYYEILGMA